MKKNINKQQILELAQDVDNFSKEVDEEVKISGVCVNGEVGFPLRVFNEECDENPGEPKNYDDAYDKACKVLKTDSCNSYKEYDFVWFVPED